MKRTLYTLVACGLISLWFAGLLAWPSIEYAMGMMAVDAVAATIVLFNPAGRAQSLIGLTFLLQCGVHAGRIMNGNNADIDNYWAGLSILAFLQLFIAGGWWLHEYVYRRRHVHRDSPVPAPSHIEGMER